MPDGREDGVGVEPCGFLPSGFLQWHEVALQWPKCTMHRVHNPAPPSNRRSSSSSSNSSSACRALTAVGGGGGWPPLCVGLDAGTRVSGFSSSIKF
jgi:hypothetical protein